MPRASSALPARSPRFKIKIYFTGGGHLLTGYVPPCHAIPPTLRYCSQRPAPCCSSLTQLQLQLAASPALGVALPLAAAWGSHTTYHVRMRMRSSPWFLVDNQQQSPVGHRINFTPPASGANMRGREINSTSLLNFAAFALNLHSEHPALWQTCYSSRVTPLAVAASISTCFTSLFR